MSCQGLISCILWGMFLAMSVLGGAGCIPELTCVELGCAYNEVCNRQSGLCEIPNRDCNIVGCPGDQRCDVLTGICRSEEVSCRFQPCATNQVCNTQTGFCEAAENCVLDGCRSSAEVCDLDTRRCVPRACNEDAACGAGFVCGASGRCASGCRAGQGSCPVAQYCRLLPGEEVGQCVPECRDHRDCPFGQYCQPLDGRMICLLEPPCGGDEDCRPDEVCEDRQCRAPPCASDDDCTDGAACQRSTGLCVGEQCNEDIFSPNHFASSAAIVTPGEYANLTLCPGRRDWFALPVRSTDVVSLRLERPVNDRVEVRLFDEGGRVVAADSRATTVALLQYVATHAQTLRVEVFAPDFEEVTYALSYSLNLTAICIDDAFEENDRREQAATLPTNPGSPTELPLRICGFDEDWFVLPRLPASAGLLIRFRSGPAGFVGRLYTPDGAVFEPAHGESLRLRRLGVAGDYYLQAFSRQGTSGSYRMLHDVLEPWICVPGAGATSRETAPMLAANERGEAGFCPDGASWQLQWYRLDHGEHGGMARVRLDPGPNMPTVRLALFRVLDNGDIELVRAAGADLMGSVTLGARLELGSDYFVRIDSPSTPGRIFEAPRYEIGFDWTPDPEQEPDEPEDPEPDGDASPGELSSQDAQP
jgi:hypothetical protein